MFERFTERARQIIVLAQDEARALRHGYIGTEHLLVALLREEQGLAARVLESFDVTTAGAREALIKRIGLGDEVASGQIPFTPRGKKVLDLSLREALSLGHNYIGTEHLLLGLLREGEGVGSKILTEDFSLTDDQIRNEVVRVIGGPAPRWRPSEEPEEEKGPPVLEFSTLQRDYIHGIMMGKPHSDTIAGSIIAELVRFERSCLEYQSE